MSKVTRAFNADEVVASGFVEGSCLVAGLPLPSAHHILQTTGVVVRQRKQFFQAPEGWHG
ncbi:MAG: hypothetical protein ACO30S_07930 [Flavobacteriaceae bacterium]